MAQVQVQPQPPLSGPNGAANSGASQFMSTSLYVGDLEPNVTDSQLYYLFSQLGPVVSVQLDLSPFSLHSLLKEVVGIAKLLCNFRGFSFHFDISKQVLDFVIGAEKRLLKAVMYMVRNVAGYGDQGHCILRVCTKGGSLGDKNLVNMRMERIMEKRRRRR